MTAAIKGQAGRVLEFIAGAEGNVRVATVANWSGFSRHQVRAAMGRLKKLGLVERVDVNVWRRVPEVAKAIGIGDRVRVTPHHPLAGTTFTVDKIIGAFAEGRDAEGEDCFFSVGALVRLPDADETPWFPPTPPAAWAKDAGLPIRRGPPTPWQQSIGRTS